MDQRVEQVAAPETGEEPAAQSRRLPRRRRHGRIGLGMVATLSLAALIFAVAFLSLSGRSVPFPDGVRARIEAGVNERLGAERVRLGRMDFAVGRDGIPRVILRDVAIGNPAGGAVAVLNRLQSRLSPGRLLRGEVAASRLELDGAQITLRRTAEGDFAFASGPSDDAGARSVPDLLTLIDRVFATPALSSLQTVEAGGIVLTLEDARSGRIWQATNASVILRRSDRATTLTLVSDVFNGTDVVAEIQLSLARNLATSGVSLGVSVVGMPATDIALQAPVLAWLGVLDAPLSGAVRTEIDADGQVTSLAGTLDIEAGALSPRPDVPPVEFSSARTYFTFDPERQRIDFSDVTVVSDEGRLSATGHTYLAEMDGPWPGAFLGQFAVETLEFDGGGVFDGPLSVSDLRADLRLRLDPFSVDIAQVAVVQDEARISGSGRVTAEPDGWHVSVDAAVPEIRSDTVMAHWPTVVSPVTRGWLANNLSAGVLRDVAFGIRFQTGSEPDVLLNFDFEDGTARFLREMPPLTRAAGRAALFDKRFTLVLDEGKMDAGAPGVLSAAGSVFTVPDTRPKPSMGEIDLVAEGPLQAALHVLDKPPLRIMERAGRSTDLAEANARAEARITLPLKDGIRAADVDYNVSARLTDVASDAIVEGRSLTSEALALEVTTEAVRISGPLELDGVPVRADWRQPLGARASEGSRAEGTIALSRETVEAFGLPLPEGLIGGRGTGRFALDLRPDAPPYLVLTSDLQGVTMEIDGIGWSKPASASGGFELAARLGAVPEVETLSLSAPGLALDGEIALDAAGAFEGALFPRIRVGNWLDGSVQLTPRGEGRTPAIRLSGGRLDLRRLPPGGGGSGDGAPLDVALDALVVSDGITLGPLTGEFQLGRAGLSGTFEARVNGATPVRGTLAPANAGTAVRIQSNDAGGVIRDAGLTPNAEAGTLDLVLTPVVGAPGGTYDGQFLVESIRLRKAPAMADLLDAISVVGLLDQLRGPGILFGTVDGKFRLTRQELNLTEAAAVGGSLGISADGIYDLASKRMDFQGVISPIYFVNGIGAALTRRGEGLFGFNYRVTGTASDPDVGVNPLSILTPGIFRQIFRRSPPGG